MPELIWSDALAPMATSLHRQVSEVLRRIGVRGELVVTGPASLPGVLTRGDIDLHLRVDPDEFGRTVERLAQEYQPASRDAWATTLAVFGIAERPPCGLAVTPIGSEHDRRFRSAWRRLREEPELLARYQQLKRDHVGTEDYERHKNDFFTSIADPPDAP